MDAMALLCNLHADGPLTAKRLRRSGCRTLEELTRMSEDELAVVLEAPVPVARRFALEARLLADRSRGTMLDEDDSLELPAPATPPVAKTPVTSTPVSAPMPIREIPRPSALPMTAIAPPAPRPRQPMERTPAAVRPSLPVTAPGIASGARPVPGSGTLLRPRLIEGLDAAWCELLVREGITTLEALADSPGLSLARRIGRPLSKLVELQLLAQTRLAPTQPPVPTPPVHQPARAETVPVIGTIDAPTSRPVPPPGRTSISTATPSHTTTFPHSGENRDWTIGGPFA